mmetsp:Transcript_37904/g.63634  ORF Transcript_37904/g.63634 Transcript_37904/m.63634 type:complete len:97 (-) Transcript_37904:303-593(-)
MERSTATTTCTRVFLVATCMQVIHKGLCRAHTFSSTHEPPSDEHVQVVVDSTMEHMDVVFVAQSSEPHMDACGQKSIISGNSCAGWGVSCRKTHGL